jgi:hypothetical protein
LKEHHWHSTNKTNSQKNIMTTIKTFHIH